MSLQERVTSLVAEYQETGQSSLAISLFRRLGWDNDDFQIVPRGDDASADECRLEVGGTAVGYVFVASAPPNTQLAGKATNVAYNSGVDWAIVTNFATTRVLNARWYDNPTLFQMSSTTYSRRLNELNLLSPRAITSGQLTEHANSKQGNRRLLPPVDEHLLDRLQAWRRALLRNSPADTGVTDQRIHELIGRLVFIRSCEDRGILEREALGPLLSARPASLAKALHDLFLQLRTRFDSELFDEQSQEPIEFDDGILSEIIGELYRPFGAPEHYRYDFSYLNLDVLGMVYQRYVATVLERVSRDHPQLTLPMPEFGTTDLQLRARQREQGTYYTPPYLVDYIVGHTLQPLLSEAEHVSDFPVVADVSCGSGAFLVGATQRMTRRIRELPDHERPKENWYRVLVDRLLGADIDRRAVALARVNLWILATMGVPPQPLPELNELIFDADTLFDPRVDSWRGKLDAVVGNPPFRAITSITPPEQERLRQRYRTASGRFDLAYVFLERSLELVRPGGRIGLVMPNRIFTNSDARFLRQLIADEAILERVVDLTDQNPFHGAQSYITLLVLRKRLQDEESNERVFVHRILRLSEHPGLQLRHADLVGPEGLQTEQSQVFMADQPSGHGPWIWSATDWEDKLERKLATEAERLDTLALVRQGVKTGENRLFLVRRVGTDVLHGHWIVENGFGERARLEPALLRPCVRRETIGRYGIPLRVEEYVLYPYKGGRLLDEFELKTQYGELCDSRR